VFESASVGFLARSAPGLGRRKVSALQKILFLQSMWAMQRRHTDGYERTLEANIEMIADAKYDGISLGLTKRDDAVRMANLIRGRGMVIEGQCYPTTVDDLKRVLEVATEIGVHHIDLQPNARPRCLEDCIPLLEGWRRVSEQVEFPVYIETHRDRMTTDLYFTLDLLECFPDLKLLADLSHYLVGREFAWPVSDENNALIKRILDNSWAFHGRVASREQVQIEVSFAHHKPWLDLFLDWWAYGFASWRKRAGVDDSLTFTCELGPNPYAITGADGNELSDRWSDALLLREHVRKLWTAPGASRG
jgi:hypothetical protein